jgi:hypothetical protein
VNLVGFSDGSLSGDGNNGGYSWMVALVENGVIQEGDVLFFFFFFFFFGAASSSEKPLCGGVLVWRRVLYAQLSY